MYFLPSKQWGYVVLKVVHSTVCGVVQEIRVIVFSSSFVMCTTNTALRKKISKISGLHDRRLSKQQKAITDQKYLSFLLPRNLHRS